MAEILTSGEPASHPERLPAELLVAVGSDGTELIVRRWRSTDAEVFHRAMHECFEHLQPWMPWAMAEPQHLEAHQEIIKRFSSEWNHQSVVYGIFVGGADRGERVVGGTGLHNRVGAFGWEIGYWIHPEFEGRGYMSAIVRALTDEAFVDPTVQSVEIRCDAANIRSSAVPVRLGYSFVGEETRIAVAPSETEVGHLYQIYRSTWTGQDR